VFTQPVTLFKVFGFDIRLDASWLLLAVLVTWSLAVGFFPQMRPGLSPGIYWSMGVIGLIGLAASILLHELAHALVARRYDLPIRSITLFLFGGVAELREEPRSPSSEFLVALAGPVMSFALAGLLWLSAQAIGAGVGQGAGQGAGDLLGVVAGYLATINLLLATFNLVPAYPLDGGRMLRAALWGWKRDIVWATRIASLLGSGFGVLLIVLGLMNVLQGSFLAGMWWFLIGMFVRGASSMALQQTVAREVLSGRPVSAFMRREPVAVDPGTTVDRLVSDYVYRHYYKSFPVVSGDRLLGWVVIDDVKEVPREEWGRAVVEGLMRPATEENTITSGEDVGVALDRMRQSGLSRLLVVDGGRLVGVLSLKDLIGYLQIARDLGDRRPPAPRRSAGA
jgi:Zn-dependent protease/CBS domain-containing protein